MSLMNFLHPFGVARWLHEPQSPILYPELAFLHRVGRYRSVGSPSFPCLLELWRYGRVFDPDNASQYIRYRSYIVRGEIDQKDHDYRPRVVSSCTDMDGFLIRGWDLIHPVSGANSRWPEGQLSPLAGSMSASQSAISSQSLRCGFSHRAGRYRPPYPGCWNCRELEGILVRKRENILSGYGGPRRWPKRQLSPRAGSRSLNQLALTRWSWDFHTARGRIDPGDLRFGSWVAGVIDIWRDY